MGGKLVLHLHYGFEVRFITNLFFFGTTRQEEGVTDVLARYKNVLKDLEWLVFVKFGWMILALL